MTKGKTTESFIAQSKARFGDKFDYSKTVYVNAKTPVILICTEHKYEGTVDPNNHLKSKDGCGRPCKKYGTGLLKEKEYETNQNLPKCSRCKGYLLDLHSTIHDECAKKNRENYKKRRKVTSVCKWTNPKTDVKCSNNTTNNDKYCGRHTSVGDDLDKGIVRCGSNVCNNILEKDDVYYCLDCKTDMSEICRVKRLNNYKEITKYNDQRPESFIKWLAGFIDGDGSIYLSKISRGSHCLMLGISQSSIKVLEVILKHYPGGAIYPGRKRPNQKQQYYLRYTGMLSIKILTDLSPYLIVKKTKVDDAIEYIQYINSPNSTIRKKQLIEKMTNYPNYIQQLDEVYQSRLNYAYISGLFDAEGCIYMSKHFKGYVGISQKNDPYLLKQIQCKCGIGTSNDTVFRTTLSKASNEFLYNIRQHSYVKRVQIDVALLFIILKTQQINVKEFNFDIYGMLKNEKRSGIDEFTPFVISNKSLLEFKEYIESEIYLV